MNNFDLGRLLNRFANNNNMFINRSVPQQTQQSAEVFAKSVQQPQPAQVMPNQTATASTTEMQMNALQSMDRAVYAKEVMQLPRNLNELIFMLQKGINQAQFNRMFAQNIAAQRNSLSQQQAQILAQLQGLTSPTQIQTIVQGQMASQLQASIKNLTLSPTGMINLAQISEMLQVNGKEALTKLITAMTQASKQGISDLSQIKEMAKLVNASVATAAQNNPAQTLKVLMLLYLPWLPLDEGVGFDLDIETQENGEESDSILTITISTVNYGTVVATLVLETQNSVHVSIECDKDFPKDELMLRIGNEEKQYSMNSVVTFSEKTSRSEEQTAKAKINMSQTTEINPYMLLMAHTIIRHVIEIDSNKSIGVTSHFDDSI